MFKSRLSSALAGATGLVSTFKNGYFPGKWRKAQKWIMCRVVQFSIDFALLPMHIPLTHIVLAYMIFFKWKLDPKFSRADTGNDTISIEDGVLLAGDCVLAMMIMAR